MRNRIQVTILRFMFMVLGFCPQLVLAQTTLVDKTEDLIYRQLTSTEILIRVCTVLLILFTLLFIGFFFTLLIARSIHRNKDAYEEKIKEKFELLLTGIIFIDEGEMETREWRNSKQRVITHFKNKYLRSRKNRKYLREHIVLMHKNFSGSAADVLRNLYLELKLEKEAIRELSAPDWGMQALAIRELAQLKIVVANKKIKRFTVHENEILRLEAQVAILTMEGQNPFSFLDNVKSKLTDWHQVNLARIIDQLDRSTLPMFSQWFSSKNETVVDFCIKMTQQYDQFQSIPDLIALLEHPSQLIVGEAARVIGVFQANEAQPMLLKAFRTASHDVKIKIITALGKAGTEELVPFLTQQLLQNDTEIAFAAGKALKLLGFEGEQVLVNNTESLLYGVPEICKHLLDERI